MNRNILGHRRCWYLISLVLVMCAPAAAQWKDNMGGSWNNPTSASIGNIINDQLWNRMRAKARARDKSANSAPANTSRIETPLAQAEVSKKTPAQVDAAVRFRSTGTQLRTQAFADFLSDGGTPETKKQMPAIISTLLTEYEKAARAQGKPNDLALATTAALVYNSSIYNGTPEPEDARIMEIRDALAELAAEIRDARPGGGPFDLITELPPDTDLGPWERAGLTWAVTFFGLQPTEAGVRAVIDASPD